MKKHWHFRGSVLIATLFTVTLSLPAVAGAQVIDPDRVREGAEDVLPDGGESEEESEEEDEGSNRVEKDQQNKQEKSEKQDENETADRGGADNEDEGSSNSGSGSATDATRDPQAGATENPSGVEAGQEELENTDTAEEAGGAIPGDQSGETLEPQDEPAVGSTDSDSGAATGGAGAASPSGSVAESVIHPLLSFANIEIETSGDEYAPTELSAETTLRLNVLALLMLVFGLLLITLSVIANRFPKVAGFIEPNRSFQFETKSA